MSRIKSRTSGCLFCGNDQARFESEEHIIALTLGNTLESGLVETEQRRDGHRVLAPTDA
jgi:hypothetical protein